MIHSKFTIFIVLFQLFRSNYADTIDKCLTNPCFHGGVCQQDLSSSHGFKCICPSKYSGFLCERDTEMHKDLDILMARCLNMGYKGPSGECICINGYSGRRCQIPPFRFNSNPIAPIKIGCLNGGFQPKSGLPCKCLDGFYGFMCEYMNHAGVDLTACITAPCRNGGICAPSSSGSYTCTCRNGFYGHNCENILYRRTYGGFGSLLPFLLFFSLITMCVYCCCFKKNRNFTHNIINQRRFTDTLEGRINNPSEIDRSQPNHAIYVHPNSASAEPQKIDGDLPPSYDEVVKKPNTTNNV